MLPDLPGWDSLSAVSRYSSWAEIAGIIIVGALVVAEVVSYKYGHRKDDLIEQQQNATNQRHDEDMARVQHDTAQANERAAKLENENLKLQAAIEPRRLTPEQQSDIAKELAPFEGKTITLSSYALDAESAVLAGQIRDALTLAKMQPNDSNLMTVQAAGSIQLGIHISAKDEALANALLSALGKYLAATTQQSPSRGFIAYNFNFSAMAADASIFIGVKPLAK
jgi:hypothetical protein